VRYLVAEAGIRQFLDIGTGLPTANNVHEVAQSVVPESRVVYVDNDPIVLAHARALLISHPAGRTAYIQADLHDPNAILRHPAVRETLDLGQPVALMLVAVLHFFPDDQDPAGIVSALLAALAPGSYLVASHTTADYTDPRAAADGVQAVHRAGVPFQTRTADEFTELAFAGLGMIEPGLVPVSEWRPEATAYARCRRRSVITAEWHANRGAKADAPSTRTGTRPRSTPSTARTCPHHAP
jgi:S-adenosyl methyltransferase